MSIVVPTFNYARFLPEALDSLTRQAGVQIEVIVIDDGSSDDPSSVVARYDGVRLIRQGNKGLPAARNIGLAAARAGMIMFVDADDRLLPDSVATLLRLFEENPGCGFVHGTYRSVDSAWNPIWTPAPLKLGHDAYRQLLENGNMIGVPAAVMYDTERLRSVNGFSEQKRLRGNEDFELYLRMLQHFPTASSPLPVAEYRYHDQNMSGDPVLMLKSGREVVRSQWPFVRQHPQLRPAYRAGLSNIQRYWIRSHLRDIVRRRVGPKARMEGLLQIARFAPVAPAALLTEVCSTATSPSLWRRSSLVRS